MLGITPVLTRVKDVVQGESGVHPDGRGADFRDKYLGKSLYSEDERNALISMINAMHPRSDGYKTCIWHSFGGGPEHFHLQVPPKTK